MISIVTCSCDNLNFLVYEKNIANTISCAYELIKIDNSDNQYGLCEAYNLGTKKAKFDIVCFIHEDVEFLTVGWGLTIISLLNDESIGAVGVMGSPYYSLPPLPWFSLDEIESHFIQSYPGKSIEHDIYFNRSVFDKAENTASVKVIDGVFMATRKSVAIKNQFDSLHFPGFHGYDMDFSLQVAQTSKLVVAKNILLKHHSNPDLGRSWIKAIENVNRKWKKKLPIYTNQYSTKRIEQLNINALRKYCYMADNRIAFYSRVAKSLYFACLQKNYKEWTRILLHSFVKKIKSKFRLS
jgi:hypothetical protein